MTATQTTTCRRCGRTLTSTRSIREANRNGGYGRGCAHTIEAAAHTSTAPAAQIDEALELIEDGALQHWTHTLYLAVSSDGRVLYEVCPDAGTHGSCTCKAGQYGRYCYHLLAVRLLTGKPAVPAAAVEVARPADPFAVFADAA